MIEFLEKLKPEFQHVDTLYGARSPVFFASRPHLLYCFSPVTLTSHNLCLIFQTSSAIKAPSRARCQPPSLTSFTAWTKAARARKNLLFVSCNFSPPARTRTKVGTGLAQWFFSCFLPFCSMASCVDLFSVLSEEHINFLVAHTPVVRVCLSKLRKYRLRDKPMAALLLSILIQLAGTSAFSSFFAIDHE